MNIEQKNKLTDEILNEINRCMARVLDDCELEVGDSPRWCFFRCRILKIFGDRGLAGKIVAILKNLEQL